MIPVVNIPIGESNEPVPHAGEMAMAYIRNTDSQSAVLSKRGWVLQERILAPRVLHFGKSQVLWECNTSISSEAQPKFDKWKSVHVLLAHPDIRPNYKRRTVWKTTIGYEPPSFENPIDCIFIEWVLVSVIEATTTPLTSDDTGQLQGGSLTLKCRLLRAILAKGPRDGQIGAEKLETLEGIRIHHQREKWAGYLMRFDTVEDERCSPVLFVPIQVEEDKENRTNESRIRGNYYGLVLEKSENSYKRIGKLRYDIYEPTLGSWFDDIDVPWGKITIL
ncbi:ATPase family AAA domain-containing protein 3B [Colletotrichum sp. SAR 10_70]|nr:ATPase family AAA domain-containing protein 3B [Colletotrichum sp. SAR 10_71]KAI8162994.1 ATPase family AAA domain-containing protein 3B [Colletotrichum sp. SAR 10_70]